MHPLGGAADDGDVVSVGRLREREAQHELLDAGEPVGSDRVQDAERAVHARPSGSARSDSTSSR